jgi:phage tail sheath gpL-like
MSVSLVKRTAQDSVSALNAIARLIGTMTLVGNLGELGVFRFRVGGKRMSEKVTAD